MSMTDDELDALKIVLDAELAGVHSNKGIKFGVDAYSGFARRGWFTNETFTAFGSGAFPIKLPAYDKTRFAVPDYDLADNEVIVPK